MKLLLSSLLVVSVLVLGVSQAYAETQIIEFETEQYGIYYLNYDAEITGDPNSFSITINDKLISDGNPNFNDKRTFQQDFVVDKNFAEIEIVVENMVIDNVNLEFVQLMNDLQIQANFPESVVDPRDTRITELEEEIKLKDEKIAELESIIEQLRQDIDVMMVDFMENVKMINEWFQEQLRN